VPIDPDEEEREADARHDAWIDEDDDEDDQHEGDGSVLPPVAHHREPA